MKTKQFYFGIFMAFVAMMFTACSSSDETQNEHGTQLRLSAGITAQKLPYSIDEYGTRVELEDIDAKEAKITNVSVSESMTRNAVQNNNWQNMTNRNVSVQVGGNIYQYSVDVDGNFSSASPYYFVSANNIAVTAWYPYSTSLSSFSVQTNQSSYANYEKSDLMYASGYINQGTTNILNFSHKTAKVIFNVNMTGTNNLHSVDISKITLSGVYVSGSVSSGNITNNGSVNSIVMYRSASSNATTTSTATFEACIVPQTSVINYTIDYGSGTYTGTLSSKAYVGGSVYTCTVALNVQATGSINGHTWVRLGLPSNVKWATTNIGASSDTEAGGYYAWADIKDKTQFDYSTYICAKTQTGTKDDPVYAAGKLNENGLGITGDSRFDVARVKWNSTWRTPTSTEYIELGTYCTWVWTTKNGVKGYSVTSKTNTSCSIFIPALGYNGSPNAERCCYWSANSGASNASISLGYNMYLRYVDDDDNGWTERSYGYHIRAVTD